MAGVDGVGAASAVDAQEFQEPVADVPQQEEKQQPLAPQGSYQEKVGFNQEGLTKTTLQAKADVQTQGVQKLDAASEAKLAKVNPELANRVRAMAADLKAQGINVRVTDGLRTFEEQNALYAKGRTAPGNIVTKVRGGGSFHNYGLAVDVVPLDKNGKANYNVGKDVWNKIGAAGQKQGLTWGGAWKGFVDQPHFQLDGGKTSAKSYLDTYNKKGLQGVWNEVNGKTPIIKDGNQLPPKNPNQLPPKDPNALNPKDPNALLPKDPNALKPKDPNALPPKNPGIPLPPKNQLPPKNVLYSTTQLEKGARSNEVKNLQQNLTKLGYDLKDDGIFGAKTDAAVRWFQADHGLKVDGIVGAKTNAALDKASTQIPTEKMRRGAEGEQVKQLQDALVKLGYLNKSEIGNGYGQFGVKTAAAVRQLQSDSLIESDGIYGKDTQAKLREALGAPQADRLTNPAKPTAPTDTTKPTTPAATTPSAAKINDILKGTGMAEKGELISQLAKKYNIPAELALSMFRMEAGFAKPGTLAAKTNNPGNIKYVGQAGATKEGPNAKWKTMDEGIEAYFKLLDKGYRKFIDNKDWSGLVNKYAPPSENDTNDYINNINNWMSGYRQKING